MDLKHLTNYELHSQTLRLVEKERLSLIEILWHLRENERRMLYAEKGYRDLKQYCIQEMKYSEGAAWRRISAMRLLNEIPEMEDQIQTGSLNLTQINLAQATFREMKPSKSEKQEILIALENQSTLGTQRILAEQQPELQQKPEVQEKPLKGQKLQVTLILDEELQNKMDEVELLLGKKLSKLELLRLMTTEMLTKLRRQTAKTVDKKRRAQPPRSRAAEKSRYVPHEVIRQVRYRDNRRCQFRDPETGRQCEARHDLQIDHIVPFAKGGRHNIENLQLLCKGHNRLRAVQTYGSAKMKVYLPSLR